MKIRNLTQAAFRRSGYIVQRWPPEGSLACELKRLIKDRHVDTVLDIGAHVGVYGAMLRDIGFTGRIVSFEPSPEPFAHLQARSRSDLAWDVMQVAVGDQDGTAGLHLYTAHSEYTSLHPPSELGRDRWGLTEAGTIDVSVRRLDEIVTALGVASVNTLVKIDTQGHDAPVMTGGANTLKAAAGLQLELPIFGLYEGAASFGDLFDRARSYGLALLGTFPVHEHPRPLVPVELDGLFARSD